MENLNEQENFWRGQFGDDYVDRNQGKSFLASDIYLFSRILEHTTDIHSVIEFGSNIGLNLMALRTLIPDISCDGVEINHKAASSLASNPFFGENPVRVFEKSLLAFSGGQYDLTLSKGVLIHNAPENLPIFYEKLYSCSRKYIVIAEYYNPSPVEVSYRGNANKLFKRDFAGEMLDTYSDLQLVDYGFVYHRDNNYPMDDVTWFLLEKNEK